MKNKKPELILPAGDYEKARFAFMYGADTCYGGLAKHSLRKAEVNFTISGIERAIKLAHSLGKKFYVTFNIFPHDYNLADIEKDVKEISRFKPDAFIVSDPGVIQFIKNNSKVPIHLSTQANTLNWRAVKFWQSQGIKRIVLARELTLKEIVKIKRKVPKMELEIFVHGAMCISYSGRCLLSAFLTGREANQGTCTQPCRWNYTGYIEEELRPGQFMPVEQNKKGTYIFNSKDLRLIKYLPSLIKAGISGFKIEGRNKSEYYLSTIARAYRNAVGSYYSKNFKKNLPENLAETEKIAHRDYTSGFLFGFAKAGETYNRRSPIENYSFLGLVYESKDGWIKTIARNQIKQNEKIEILTPDEIYQEKIGRIKNQNGEEVKVANPLPNKTHIKIKLSQNYPKDSIIRKRIK